MKADSSRQLQLLDLQAIDTKLGQIAHRRSHLPVLAELADLEGKARLIDDQIVRAKTALDDVQREVARAEADVQLVRDRAARDRARLDTGVGTSKDLVAVQHELESLARRQSGLEDVELEVMERAEALESDLTNLTEGSAKLAVRIEALSAGRDKAVAELDAEAASVAAPRADLVERVGSDLVALYDKIAASNGTGAAALRQKRCLGCQLEVNPTEIQRIRSAPQDEVLRCEECRRILVRTLDSGL